MSAGQAQGTSSHREAGNMNRKMMAEQQSSKAGGQGLHKRLKLADSSSLIAP
jgi:hypothetical protein